VLRTARQRPEPVLMTVFRNDGEWDTSNVVLADGRVVRYEKGLDPRPAEMRWIDYGLTAWRREVIAQRIRPGVVADMAPVLTELAAQRLLAGLEVDRRFYEIGSVAGRNELEAFLALPDAEPARRPS
jgi:hypothetical protein